MGKDLRASAALPIVDPANYTILGEFAKGGFGKLLRAHDRRLNRQVALKELFQETEEAEERFIREALVTARLQHPSIVPIHEVGRWPTGELFYSMKFVSGRGLDELIAEARSLHQRLALVPHVLAVAEAIAYAHSARIIHRDLKPANVLVGAFGETVLIDWGLAKDLAEDAPPSGTTGSAAAPLPDPGAAAHLTHAGAVLGTPAYMSPEQALSRDVDERTDVYALGAILFHVLAGAPPHEGSTVFEVLVNLNTKPVPDLKDRQQGVPPELAAIAKKAMAVAPGDRYPTAQELARDLRAFQTGQIVRAYKYSLSARARRIVRRYRATVAVATAAILVLAVGAGIFVQRIRRERDRARQERDRAEDQRMLVEAARREADDRADELTILQARSARDVDPNAALTWLGKLSPAFAHWGAVRTIAADARARGVARVFTGHTGGINDADLSPDGKSIAFVSDDRRASIWDLATGTPRFLSGHTDEVWSVTFSADGKRLATGSRDGTVRIWDVGTGESRALAGGRGPIWQSSFLPDGARLIAFSNRGTGTGAVYLWDLARGEGKEIEHEADAVALPVSRASSFVAWCARGDLVIWDQAKGEAKRLPGQASPAAILAVSPDEARVATLDGVGKVRLWSVKDGKSKILAGPAIAPDTLIFSPDGRRLAAGEPDGTLRIWDLASGEGRDLRGHEATIHAMRFSPDGSKIATGSTDRTVRLWDVETGESRIFRGFTDAPTAIVFSKDGGVLVAAGWDHSIRVWDLGAHDSAVLARHEGGATALAFFRGGRCVASAGKDGVIRGTPLVLAGDPAPADGCGHLGDKPAHDGPITAIAASDDGRRIVSTGQDGTVRVNDVDGGEQVVLRGHEGPVLDLAISPNGKVAATGGKDGTARIWVLDRREGTVVAGHAGAVDHVAFSPNGSLLASAGEDGAVRVWDLNAQASREIRSSDTPTKALAFSTDGSTLGFGDDRHNLFLWKLADPTAREITQPRSLHQITFFRGDASLIAVSLKDVVIRVRDTKSGEATKALRGHLAEVLDLALSPDENRVASADQDGVVRLWDLESGESRVLDGHTKAAVRVLFSPDGKMVITASADGTVRAFRDDLPTDAERLRAWLKAAAPGG